MAFNQGVFDEVNGLLNSGRSVSDIAGIVNSRLAETGTTAAQLADAIGVPVSAVNGYLGIPNTPAAPATPAVAPIAAPMPAQAERIDVRNALSSLGAADPTGSIQQMLSGQVNTSTLDPVVANAQRRLGEQFTEQVLPGIRGGAMSAGQYGGSRQGIAEGLAARGLGYAMGDMSANMYNQAYQDAQNRMASTANNMANLGFGAATANAQMGNQMGIANMQNQLGYAGLNTQRDIANQQNALGYAGLTNQFNIANLNNATQRGIADLNNATQTYGINRQYDLGMTNAANNRYGTDKQYEVGMASANAAAANAAAAQAYNQGRLGLERDQFGFNSALTLDQYNRGITNLGIGMGQDIYNMPMNYYNQFSNTANSLAGQGGVSSQNYTGNPMMGAMGGYMLGGQMGNMFSNSGGAYPGGVVGTNIDNSGARINNPSAYVGGLGF